MQVRDFIDLLIEESLQEICIFDITSGNDVFNGKADKIPSKYEDFWAVFRWALSEEHGIMCLQ